MTLAVHPAQTRLPHQFPAEARRAHLRSLDRDAAVRVGGEVLMRALNVMAFVPGTRREDPRIAKDKRFRVALAIAAPVTLRASPGRCALFREVARRADRRAMEAGVAGPVGRALQSARLISQAVQSCDADARELIDQAVSCAIEAEVLAASLDGGDLAAARAKAEARALSICNPPRRAA